MSTEDVSPGPGRASSSMSQPFGGHFLNNIPLSSGMRNMILSSYNGARNVLYGYSPDPAPSTETSEEPFHLQPLNVINEQFPNPPKPARLPSLPVTDEQVPNNDQAPEDTLGQPPLDHNSTFASQGDDLEAGGGDESNGARHNSNRTSLCVTVLIVGVLFLVVVPGLALGFATRQVQWGIALSGSVGTVVGVFAGLGKRAGGLLVWSGGSSVVNKAPIPNPPLSLPSRS